jgi:hypothetical protein
LEKKQKKNIWRMEKKQKKTKKLIKKTTILFEYYLIADKDTTKDVELVGFLKDNLCTLQMP